MVLIQWAIVSPDELEAQKQEIAGLKSDLQIALDKGKEITIAFNQAVTERNTAQGALLEANKALAASVAREKELQARILELTKPPVVIPPPGARPRIITKQAMSGVIGICVDKDDAPSLAQDANARNLMVLAQGLGFNAARMFFNLQEVKKFKTLTPDDPAHLPAFARKIGLAPFADTVNWAAVNLNDIDLKIYIEEMAKWVDGFWFDDANQYRDITKYPKGELERLVGRIRVLAPNMPLIASLTATAVINDYKPLFDFVEAQTFGTIAELGVFLKRDFDVFCLEGRTSRATVEYLKAAEPIILANNPDSLFYYCTTSTEWAKIPLQTAIIKGTVQKWRALV